MKQLPTHLLTRCHKISCFFRASLIWNKWPITGQERISSNNPTSRRRTMDILVIKVWDITGKTFSMDPLRDIRKCSWLTNHRNCFWLHAYSSQRLERRPSKSRTWLVEWYKKCFCSFHKICTDIFSIKNKMQDVKCEFAILAFLSINLTFFSFYLSIFLCMSKMQCLYYCIACSSKTAVSVSIMHQST